MLKKFDEEKKVEGWIFICEAIKKSFWREKKVNLIAGNIISIKIDVSLDN